MKIIKVYIISFVLLILMYILGMYIINSVSDEKMDLAYINDVTKHVNEEYERTQITPVSMDGYQIITTDDENYMSELYTAMDQDSVITDLVYRDKLAGKLIFGKDIRRNEIIKNRLLILTTVVYLFVFMIMSGFAIYTYFYILKPFQKLQHFAGNVAAGNFDFPLAMNRKNYFGAFTESFDLMREELSRARKSEYEANKSKKEILL